MKPRHIVGLSGGKDSTAMALRLKELHPEIDFEYIGNFTGNEPPELHAHIAQLEFLLGKRVQRVTYKTDLFGLIEEMQMLPNFRARFCTRMLKIEPTIEFFESLPPGSVLYVGLRADEEEREGLFGEDIIVECPMRAWGWGLAEVEAYNEARGQKIPVRTDCMLCPYQRLDEWHALWRDNRVEYERGIAVEVMHGHTFRSPGRDTWPASLLELHGEFMRGRQLRKRHKKNPPCRVCTL